MPLTQVRGGQVQDGSIQRVDLDVSTVGQAVIRKLLAGAGLSLASDGADAGTGDVTLSAPNSANWDSAYSDRYKWDGGSAGLVAGTARTSLGANALGSNIFTMANNALGVPGFLEISNLNAPVLKTAGAFLTDLGGTTVGVNLFSMANSALGLPGYIEISGSNVPTLKNANAMLAALGGEPALGNPSANGYILSSTTSGARSWIAPPAGASTITLTGDITGSGTTTIATQIAANAVTAAEIAANTIGASEMNNTQDMLMAAAQSIRVADAGNNVLNVLRISHNYTSTPTANAEGTALSFEGKSDTTVDRTLAQIKAQWSVATDASRTSYLDLGTVASGILSTALRCWGSNGVSINNTTDPGAGYVNVPTAGGYKINNVNIFGPSMGSMANGDALRAIGTGTFDSFTANSLFATPTDKAGTANTSGVMLGLAQTLQMQYSGRVMVIMSGRMGNNTTNGYGSCIMRYGTGTAPANGAAATGTQFGGYQYGTNGATANQINNFTCVGIVTGLTKGTTYWFDLLFAATAGTFTIYNVGISVIEL